MNTDYEYSLPHLLIVVSPDMEVRTDGSIFEITYVKPLPASYEHTHKAINLGRFATLDACARMLATKVGLYYPAGSDAVETAKAFAATLIRVENAVTAHVSKVLTAAVIAEAKAQDSDSVPGPASLPTMTAALLNVEKKTSDYVDAFMASVFSGADVALAVGAPAPVVAPAVAITPTAAPVEETTEVFAVPTTIPQARAKTLTKTLDSQGRVQEPVKRLRASKKGS